MQVLNLCTFNFLIYKSQKISPFSFGTKKTSTSLHDKKTPVFLISVNWKMPVGRPRHTWMRAVTSDLLPLNLGSLLHTVDWFRLTTKDCKKFTIGHASLNERGEYNLPHLASHQHSHSHGLEYMTSCYAALAWFWLKWFKARVPHPTKTTGLHARTTVLSPTSVPSARYLSAMGTNTL